MYLYLLSPNSYFPLHLSYSVVPYNNFSSSPTPWTQYMGCI